MDISIIIPSKDRKSILSESLNKAYRAIATMEAEILVINDSKTEDILLKPEWIDKVKIYNNPKSGVASARNLGAEKAKADLLLFMDDDMWIAEENIRATLNLHKIYPQNCCINLNWVYPPELQKQNKKTQFGRYLTHFGFDSLRGWCKGLNWNDQELFPIGGITSQYLAINKTDFYRAGGYNEKFPHAGFEDHDFSKRLLSHKIQPYIYPLSMIYHNEADRMDVRSWLARKQRGGETRRVAVEMGYTDLKYNYGLLKSLIYKSLVSMEGVMFRLLSAIPNLTVFDFLYFRLLNLMLGTILFAGYYQKPKK